MHELWTGYTFKEILLLLQILGRFDFLDAYVLLLCLLTYISNHHL
jgi:hypothetical protein